MNTKHKSSEVVNFLPEQYQRTGELAINHNYLPEQFADYPVILEKIAEVVRRGDFTLGEAVDRCEALFADRVGADYAVGVGSGTDALFLSLKVLGIGPGDEVITTPFTFYATVGAIVTAGAKPVFVDIKDNYNIDENQLEAAITNKTKAIVPVHWAGRPCNLDVIRKIADKHALYIVQDACHAIDAIYHGQTPVNFGDVACYSMHPLKNLNVWGDAGFVTTMNPDIAQKLSLLRNHGLSDRDTCEVFAYNSRLDTLQAVVGIHLMENRLDNITDSRIEHAHRLDSLLKDIKQVECLPRDPEVKEVFHLYQFNCENRDELLIHLNSQGIDAKVHYPVPMHLQPAASEWGYKKGDFPKAECVAASTLSLPVHEYISEQDLMVMTEQIRRFYQ
jgi:dTDP-4-amino-4,6-dideoxygalactose transaminase